MGAPTTTGNGSRLRLYECRCKPKHVKVRVASDHFKATCDTCGGKFRRVKAVS